MFFKGFMMSIYFSTTLREENFSREENFAVFAVFIVLQQRTIVIEQ